MTHETGHTYGLNHSDAGGTDHSVHGNLTMNSILDACTTKYRTLGAGDLNAMGSPALLIRARNSATGRPVCRLLPSWNVRKRTGVR